MCRLEVDWDPDIEDRWSFDKLNKSIFIKINDFEPRNYERIIILFEFVITVKRDDKTLDISCGSANVAAR